MGGRSGQAIRGTATTNSSTKNDNSNSDYKKADLVTSANVSQSDAAKYANAAGIPNDYKGLVYVLERKKGVFEVVVNNNNDILMTRTIDTNNKIIHNDLFVIKSKKYDGSDVFTAQVEKARKQGYTKIVTEAAGKSMNSGTKFNGYYTWLRLGYKPNAKTDAKFTERFNRQTGSNIKSITELMHSESGRAWWKKNGNTFKGEFDLNPNSESSKVLNNYNKQ